MEVKMNPFTVWDYLTFFATLIFSMAVGVYFAFQGRKTKSEGEYLMASRSMSVIPVSVSITVSFFSAISILGNPAEMYNQGSKFILRSIGVAGGCIIAATVFVPLLYPLQLTSTYEYLERRYNSRAVRLLGTCIQIVSQVIYMGTASFAPATALYIVTGFPLWATLLITVTVATFYTSVGGMKAVIWTDVFQCAVMLIGVFAIIIQGSIKVGGFSKVWDINEIWGRLDIWNFDPDPRVRHSFWGLTVGTAVNWMGTFGLSQSAIQRYGSLPSLKKAKMAAFLTMFGANTITVSCCVAGVVIFAYYVTENCDPIGKKLVDNSNQLVPFFVMETLAYPCVPGLFISALFSGALSSISSSLNSLAAITWEDLLKPVVGKKIVGASKKLLIIQGIVIVYGCLSLVVSFVVQNLEGTVVQISISLIGTTSSPLTGIFILGAFFPWATAKGAIGGALLSFAFGIWIAIGSFVTGVPKDKFNYPNGTCSAYFKNESVVVMATTPFTTTTVHPLTATMMKISSDERTGVEQLYTISYLWYSSIGMTLTVILGLTISFITGPNKIEDVPLEYQIPLATRILCCLPNSWQRKLNCNRTFEEPEDIWARNASKNVLKKETLDTIPTRDNDKIEFDNLAFNKDNIPQWTRM